jgi:hypothetical protein
MNSLVSTIADAKKTNKNINKTPMYFDGESHNTTLIPFSFDKKKSHKLLPSITQP